MQDNVVAQAGSENVRSFEREKILHGGCSFLQYRYSVQLDVVLLYCTIVPRDWRSVDHVLCTVYRVRWTEDTV
jgi:hypothetical protein